MYKKFPPSPAEWIWYMQFAVNAFAFGTFWFFRGDTHMLDQWIPADCAMFLAIAAYYRYFWQKDKANDAQLAVVRAE